MDNNHTMVDIDNMDIMFYFDILAYRREREELETMEQYDSMGV